MSSMIVSLVQAVIALFAPAAGVPAHVGADVAGPPAPPPAAHCRCAHDASTVYRDELRVPVAAGIARVVIDDVGLQPVRLLLEGLDRVDAALGPR